VAGAATMAVVPLLLHPALLPLLVISCPLATIRFCQQAFTQYAYPWQYPVLCRLCRVMCSGKCEVIGMPSLQINESVQGSAATRKSVSAPQAYTSTLVTLTKLASIKLICILFRWLCRSSSSSRCRSRIWQVSQADDPAQRSIIVLDIKVCPDPQQSFVFGSLGAWK